MYRLHLFIHSLTEGYLSFHLSAIVNSAALNISVQVFVWMYFFFSLCDMHRVELLVVA